MTASSSLDTAQNKLFEMAGDTASWCNEQYDSIFSQYFKGIPKLYEKVTASNEKLTDDDLEFILTSAPLSIIAASEQLSQYKLNNECLKLYIKKMESEYITSCEASTVSEKREKASLHVMDYRLLSKAYEAVISRVDNQVNFTRELIMSAKKIWDARVKTYEASPVESDGRLADYTYIK